MLGINQNALAAMYQNQILGRGGKSPKTPVEESGFTEQIKAFGELSEQEAYRDSLEKKYGAITVANIGKDQRSMDNLGAGTVGSRNIVIAPNILEEMAKNPQKAAYYEKKIQEYFDSLPRTRAELSMMGHEIYSSGVVIHEDGTVTYYISGDLKPEVRARIKARMKAEDKEKALRKKQYQKRSQKAVEKRKQERGRSKTESDVIVKPDGSRILMVTTNIGGMQTVMSLEISKPTVMQNDISRDKDKMRHKGQLSQAAEAYETSSVMAAMGSGGLKE